LRIIKTIKRWISFTEIKIIITIINTFSRSSLQSQQYFEVNTMLFSKTSAIAALLVSIVAASPCPFGDLAERGLLPDHDAKRFFAVRDLGEAEAEHQLKKREAEIQKREFADQAKFHKRQLLGGLLPNGGGLLGGILQPLTGALSGLALPT
jgi:hypothetical protein